MLRTVLRGVNTKMQRRMRSAAAWLGLPMGVPLLSAGCTDIMAVHNPRVLIPTPQTDPHLLKEKPMRLTVLALVLAILTSLVATLPVHANQELTDDLQNWLVGRWVCEYSPSLKVEAIYGADKDFMWIFSIGRVPYATVLRQMGSYEIIAPGNDGHQAAILATVQRTLPEDPAFEPGNQEQADFTRTGADSLRDSNGECERTTE